MASESFDKYVKAFEAVSQLVEYASELSMENAGRLDSIEGYLTPDFKEQVGTALADYVALRREVEGISELAGMVSAMDTKLTERLGTLPEEVKGYIDDALSELNFVTPENLESALGLYYTRGEVDQKLSELGFAPAEHGHENKADREHTHNNLAAKDHGHDEIGQINAAVKAIAGIYDSKKERWEELIKRMNNIRRGDGGNDE